MSGELDIRGGGAVAVDTETLRVAASRYAGLEAELVAVGRQVRAAAALLADAGRVAYEASYSAGALIARVDGAAATAASFVERLRFSAAVYEIVELRVASDAAEAAGVAGASAALDARIRRLSEEYPWAAAFASARETDRALSWPLDLAAQTGWWSTMLLGGAALAPMGAVALLFGISALGRGTIPERERLVPASTPVRVTPVASSSATAGAGGTVGVSAGTVPVMAAPGLTPTAPATLAQAAERIPSGSGPARVRVETYTMPDGTRQFAVYVAGTRDNGGGGPDPFDMDSNLQLYTGEQSASHEATILALRDAGAQPGDVVHAFGHSQGAMITAHLALEGGYDTRTLVSFGSPVEADVGDGTLSVAVRHTDDPVAALEGGGHLQSVGAPGSFVAERVADPMPGLHDLHLPAHGLDAYAETATMLDESTDPRMGPVRALFDELATAQSVDVVEYAAERISPSASDGG